VVYFAVWIAVAFVLSRWSRQQDASGETPPAAALPAGSAPRLVLYGLTITLRRSTG